VADLEVEVLPDKHLNLVSIQFVSLAALLTRYVQKADSQIPQTEVSGPSPSDD